MQQSLQGAAQWYWKSPGPTSQIQVQVPYGDPNIPTDAAVT